jgi:hypothetical protein
VLKNLTGPLGTKEVMGWEPDVEKYEFWFATEVMRVRLVAHALEPVASAMLPTHEAAQHEGGHQREPEFELQLPRAGHRVVMRFGIGVAGN